MTKKEALEDKNYHRTQMQKDMILQQLKEKGCRITKQRLLLLDIILEQECSSCKEIYYQANRLDASIGIATVYRMINILEEIGAVSRQNIYAVTCSGDNCQYAQDYHEIIRCVTGALDARNGYTMGHSQKVSDLVLFVCSLLKVPQAEAERIHVAAHLHDIGKMSIPDTILNKKEPLTEYERQVLRKHPQIGAEILRHSRFLKDISRIVLHHHENYDGSGYPQGLSGKEIPLGARIISICDAVIAMTTDQGYRKAHSYEDCKKELEKQKNGKFDPDIVNVILRNWMEIVKKCRK